MKIDPRIVTATIPSEVTPSQASPKGDAVPSAEMVRYGQLQQLMNTWAKVESSQLLDPIKTQQALATLPPATNKQNPATGNPAVEPIKAGTQPLQLALIELKTAKGLISILSPKLYDKGTMLLISQNAKGQWQLQTSTRQLSLTALSHQYRDLTIPPNALKLVDTHQSQLQLTSTQSKPLPVPSSMLHSDLPLDVKQVKKAMDFSGQFLEKDLRHLRASAVTPEKPATTFDVKQSLVKVESQLQKWIQALPVSLKKQGSNPSASQAPSHQVKPDKPLTSPTPKLSEKQQATKPSSQDGKAWLIQLQKQLFKQWQSQATSITKPSVAQATANNGNYKQASIYTAQVTGAQVTNPSPLKAAITASLINGLDNLAVISDPNHSSKNTAIKPDQLLEWLLAPKLPASPKALSVWPENLSAQQQVHKLLQNMLTNAGENPTSPSNESTDKLLRQLLQVSQSLSRIQGEQINNRLVMQQQPENLQLNFSLPYLHQQAMHWCEMELSQDNQTDSSNNAILGWHLVLRFAQDTEGAFAIESHLSGNQLQLTLWAQQREALAKLNQHTHLLRHKLTAAGFQVENIQSKRGNPSKSSRQVHQSMIDVHT